MMSAFADQLARFGGPQPKVASPASKWATTNRVVLEDPSTVPVVLAAAERVGHDLPEEYRSMTSERRSGDLLPEHLRDQLGGDGAATNGGG